MGLDLIVVFDIKPPFFFLVHQGFSFYSKSPDEDRLVGNIPLLHMIFVNMSFHHEIPFPEKSNCSVLFLFV